jgi:hypothetical protein
MEGVQDASTPDHAVPVLSGSAFLGRQEAMQALRLLKQRDP